MFDADSRSATDPQRPGLGPSCPYQVTRRTAGLASSGHPMLPRPAMRVRLEMGRLQPDGFYSADRKSES